MNIIPPNEYKAAIYLRLSRDEDTKQESNSITNQRQILTNYANQQGYSIVSLIKAIFAQISCQYSSS